MRKVLFLLIPIIFCHDAFSQECFLYYPDHSNARMEYNSYTNNKLTSTSVATYSFENEGLDTIAVTVNSEVFDLKGKSIGSGQSENMCIKGFYYVSNLPSVKFTFMSTGLLMSFGGNIWREWPTTIKVGDTLRDYTSVITVYNERTSPEELIFSTLFYGFAATLLVYALEPKLSYTMQTNVSDRRVEAIEDITAISDTFKCYKITEYNISTTLTPGGKPKKSSKIIKSRMISWYAANVGLVRSESYDNEGNLCGYTLLTGLK